MSIDLQALAQAYAPELRLYPYAANGDPIYDPCSVEWYLAQVEFHPTNGPVVPPSPNLINQLPTTKPAAGQPNPYVQIPDPTDSASSPVRAGNLATAAAYVHIMQTPGTSGSNVTYDLQYWFFYAVRGMSTLRIQGPDVPGVGQVGDVNGDFAVLPSVEGEPKYLGCGEHQGDWKTVTVRIAASDALPNGRIVAVYFGQHASGIWCWPGEFDTTSTGRPGPVVYSARNTHSCFPKPGRWNQINFDHDWKVIKFSLLEWAEDGGESLDCSTNVVVIADDTGTVIYTKPAWLSFYGYWGATCTQNASYGFTSAIAQCCSKAGSYLSEVIQSSTSAVGPLIESWFGLTEDGAATPAMQNPYWSSGPGAAPPHMLPGQLSPYGVALAASSECLYVAWTGADDDHSLNIWPTANGAFTGDKSTGQQSKNNLALTLFTPPGQTNPLLYAAWTGAAGSGPIINVMPVTDSTNKVSWSNTNKTVLSKYQSSYSPALAAFTPAKTENGSIYLAWAAPAQGDLFVLSSLSGDFNKDGQLYAIGKTSTTGPALVAFDADNLEQSDALCLIWTDASNGGALTITSSASGTFSDSTSVQLAHTSSVTPAAAVFNGALYLAWMENAKICVWSSSDGSFQPNTTTQLVQIPSTAPAPAQVGPALAVFDNLLYLAWGANVFQSPLFSAYPIQLMTSDDGVNFF